MTELMPFPFCGRTPKMAHGMGEFWVHCFSCGASSAMVSTNELNAMAAWNTRSTEDRAGKRFLVFIGTNYEEDGGWDDFSEGFCTLVEAVEHGKSTIEVTLQNPFARDWWHITDTATMEVIERSD